MFGHPDMSKGPGEEEKWRCGVLVSEPLGRSLRPPLTPGFDCPQKLGGTEEAEMPQICNAAPPKRKK